MVNCEARATGKYGLSRLLAAAALLTTSPVAAQSLLLHSATVIDGTGAAPRPGTDILIEGERIIAVGRGLTAPGARRVDVAGKFVMPGLIDAHAHLHAPVLSQLSAAERAAVSAHTPRAFLYNGVTTVLNAGSNAQLLADRKAQRDGTLVAPRIYALSRPIKPEGGWGSRHGGAAHYAAEARAMVLADAAAGVDGVKISIEGGLGDEITHVEIPEDMLAATVEAARSTKLKTYIHAVGLREYRRSAGIRPAAIIHGLKHRVADDDPLFSEMADRHIAVVHTASLFRAFLAPDPRAGAGLDDPILIASVPTFMLAKMRDPAFMAEERRIFVEVTKMQAYDWARAANPIFCENIGKMHRAGIRTAVGTDAGGTVGYNFQGYNTPWEVKILTECGMTPMEALVAATRNGAEVIGVAADVGTLEPGKRADLLVLSGDPLEDIENIRAIEWIVQSGALHARSDFAYRP